MDSRGIESSRVHSDLLINLLALTSKRHFYIHQSLAVCLSWTPDAPDRLFRMASIRRPPTSTSRHAAKVLTCASFVTTLAVVAIFVSFIPHKSTLVRKDQVWHGGHPR